MGLPGNEGHRYGEDAHSLATHQVLRGGVLFNFGEERKVHPDQGRNYEHSGEHDVVENIEILIDLLHGVLHSRGASTRKGPDVLF